MELISVREQMQMGLIDKAHMRKINEGFDRYLQMTKANSKREFKSDLIQDESTQKLGLLMDDIIERIFSHVKKAHDKIYKC